MVNAATAGLIPPVTGGLGPCDALGPEAIRLYAMTAGLSESASVVAIAVALAESGGKPCEVNTKNKNGTTDVGLWQINSVHGYSTAEMKHPAKNAAAMAKISKNGTDWSPWVAYTSGAFRSFMDQATEATGEVGSIISDPLESLGDLVAAVTDAGWWKRFGLGLAGVAVAAIGFQLIAKDALLPPQLGALVNVATKLSS